MADFVSKVICSRGVLIPHFVGDVTVTQTERPLVNQRTGSRWTLEVSYENLAKIDDEYEHLDLMADIASLYDPTSSLEINLKTLMGYRRKGNLAVTAQASRGIGATTFNTAAANDISRGEIFTTPQKTLHVVLAVESANASAKVDFWPKLRKPMQANDVMEFDAPKPVFLRDYARNSNPGFSLSDANDDGWIVSSTVRLLEKF